MSEYITKTIFQTVVFCRTLNHYGKLHTFFESISQKIACFYHLSAHNNIISDELIKAL